MNVLSRSDLLCIMIYLNAGLESSQANDAEAGRDSSHATWCFKEVRNRLLTAAITNVAVEATADAS